MSRDRCQLCRATSHLRVRHRPLTSGNVGWKLLSCQLGSLIALGLIDEAASTRFGLVDWIAGQVLDTWPG